MQIEKVLEHIADQQNLKLVELDKLNFLLREYSGITNDLLLWVIHYCDKNNIPIWKEKKFENLINDSSRITQEIDNVIKSTENHSKKSLSDEFLQGHRTDEDLTVPIFGFI